MAPRSLVLPYQLYKCATAAECDKNREPVGIIMPMSSLANAQFTALCTVIYCYYFLRFL